MLTDTLLAHAGMRAVSATLPARSRAIGERAWLGRRAALCPEQFPAISRHFSVPAMCDPDEMFAMLLDALWASVTAAITPEPAGQR
ncbi:hypothetical protein [Lentzea sp. HUAS12]|uniref:hypothetical protein n=1 Tax=Lentzea sp. HUAS12 TaxID=2951806 RepID=UPI0020A20F23|nr:hypothetical protein [Lentzea sp. HUAS12]USX56290.1 hypothetical protein ND450_19960 [Lentzea sp. HUAS12]